MSDAPTQKSSPKKDIVAVVIVAGIGLMLGLNLFFLLEDNSGGSMVGKMAPEFELPVFEQSDGLRLSDYRGQVVVMDFWATWCAPCREQMPALEAVARDSSGESEVMVFSINTDDDTEQREEQVGAFLQDEELTFPTLMDSGDVRALYRVNRIPTMVVIDPAGEVTYRGEGLHGEEEIRGMIEEARDEP